MLQSCTSQFICQRENEPGGVPLRIKHLLHSSAVRYFTLTRLIIALNTGQNGEITKMLCYRGVALFTFAIVMAAILESKMY